MVGLKQVLDYSAGFPGARTIKAAGYEGAVRYIGFPDRKKCTNKAELLDFNAYGLGMALVFEDNLTSWRAGRAGGDQHARIAKAHADAIGFPIDRRIYMAIDQDVVTSGEFELMLDYLRGAGQVLGVRGVGVYGEADVIDAARTAGVASVFWQTAAWSRGRSTTANLHQLIGTVHVGGVDCDVNNISAADWGQHNRKIGGTMELTDPLDNPNWPGSGNKTDSVGDNIRYTNAKVTDIQDKVTSMAAQIAELKGMMTAFVTPGVKVVGHGAITLEVEQE